MFISDVCGMFSEFSNWDVTMDDALKEHDEGFCRCIESQR